MFSKLDDEEDAFFEWYEKGLDNDWITPTFCSTHNGMEYWTEEESVEWEDGGDPCMVVSRMKYIG